MLRADNVICGTATPGTGTLTLTASPVPPGGIDFDVFCRATGIGFGNSAALVVSYTIIEYTDSTFATAKQTEKGAGILTLGASSGIANCTLARTTKQTTATSLDSQPASQNILPGTGISIVTAANTLVFIGASGADVIAFGPGKNSGSITLNGFPPIMALGTTGTAGGLTLVNNQNVRWPFMWGGPMLVKRVYFRVESAYTGAVSNLYCRLYQINTSGQAGKLLYDFGVIGTAGSSFNVSNFTMISSGASGNGYFLTPGEYMLLICPIWTAGGSGTPQLTQWNVSPLHSGFSGASGVGGNCTLYDNNPSATAQDPAPAEAGQINGFPCFFFAPS